MYLLWPAFRENPKGNQISVYSLSDTDGQWQAHEHHRKLLQSLPSTTYPLEPVGHAAEVPESQRVSDEPFGQR